MQMIQSMWPIEDRGTAALKGIDTPIHIYALPEPVWCGAQVCNL